MLLSSLHLVLADSILPTEQTVVEGGTAEFNCAIDDYGTLNNIDWIFTWSGDNVGLYIEAETNGVVGSSESAFLKDDHGIYRTFYSQIETDFGRIHNCTLRIEKVKKGDEGEYNCAFYRHSKGGDFYEHVTARSAELRVLVPPSEGDPKCSVLTTPSNLTKENWREAKAKLTCRSSGGDPPAMLRWYSNGEEIASGKEKSNAIEQKMTNEDNGRMFLCVATSPALQVPRNCSVMPFNVPLEAELEGTIELLSVGQSVKYICRGDGLPKIEKYSWFINDLRIIADRDERYSVESSTSGSVLIISDLRVADNSSKVTCEISNPNGLSAIVSAEIQIHQTNNADSISMTLPLSIGIIAGVLAITIVPTVGFFIYRERGKSKTRLRNNSDAHETITPREYNRIESNEYEVSCQGSPTSNNQFTLANQSSPTSNDQSTYANQSSTTSNDQFAYANQSSPKSNDQFAYVNQNSPTSNDQFTYANQPSRDKDNLIASGSRVGSSAYEVVQPRRAKTPKAYKNVEGLEYADLELQSPADEAVILNPQADEMVMYTQFKSPAN